MPANSPEDVHELFARYFSAGDLEAVMSLYEPGATMLPMPGPAVSGLAAIRERVTRVSRPPTEA
jgi:ketosteroid isomerase-like protein